MIHVLEETCWVVDYPPGAGEDDRGEPHYTHDQAIESRHQAASDYPGEPVSIRMLPGPCCYVTCGICDLEPEDDDWGSFHFASEGEALAYIHGAKWRIDQAGRLVCPPCAKGMPSEPEPAYPEKLQEAMQPLYLHAGCGGVILFTCWGALCADCGVVGIPDDDTEPQDHARAAGGE